MQSRGRALLGCPLVHHLGTRHSPPHPSGLARRFQGRRRLRFGFPTPVRRTIRSFPATRGRSSVGIQVPVLLADASTRSSGFVPAKGCVLALGCAPSPLTCGVSPRRKVWKPTRPGQTNRPSSPETNRIAGPWPEMGDATNTLFFFHLFCAGRAVELAAVAQC
ncbi:hypothetical protein CGRA01v4_13478 [Colletotrichum graminicola]|nr:hypothetical protein CGRA01v4_13478 [Colletotrichum graminicola]